MRQVRALQWPDIALICGMVVTAYLVGRLVTFAPSVETERREITCAWDKLFGSMKPCQNFECVGRVLDGEMWPAPGSEDTELGVLMGPEVCHGAAEVHARVQA